MNTLKVAIKRVELLKNDLSAEIVIQKEEGHTEEEILVDHEGSEAYGKYGYYHGSSPVGDLPGDVKERGVIDKPRIAEPDTQKRQAAREQLCAVYSSPGWFSAKYMAALALEIPEPELNEKMEGWAKILGFDRKEPKARKDLRYMYKHLPSQDHRRMAGKVLGYSDLRIRLHEFFL